MTDAARARLRTAALAAILAGSALGAAAQTPSSVQLPATQADLDIHRVAESESVPFVYFNRTILVFHARLLGRGPADRAAAAHRLLDELVADHAIEPVETRPYGAAVLISVASRGAIVLTGADVDELSGETLDGVATHAAAQLRLALAETVEARAPGQLLRATVLAGLAISIAVLALALLARARRRIGIAFDKLAERQAAARGTAARTALMASRQMGIPRYIVSGTFGVIDIVIVYAVTTFALRQFPDTRPWGESMRGFLLTTAQSLTLDAVGALPGLFVVAIVIVITRVISRLMRSWLLAVQEGTAQAAWIHPETAQPTRRLLTALLWMFAVVIAYPYMPGSGTDAFKGVSVFLGLVVSFGSSGLVNQYMSGFVIMYSRSVRCGDFVRIGDVEGTVEKLGVLSTKIKTVWEEDVTIPNAVVVGQTTFNFSRTGDVQGVYTPSVVTIGYDAPWRQVHALLLDAASRTPGLRAEPKPVVWQTALEDFYVRYTLLVSLERQRTRPETLNVLNANIQDAFNEAGVQIMSPNYVLDPAAPKLVPKERWSPAPSVKT